MRDEFRMALLWTAGAILLVAGCDTREEDPCADIDVCPVPQAPTLFPVHRAELTWSHPCYSGDHIQIGSSDDPDADKPDEWLDTDRFALSGDGTPDSIKLFARVTADDCTPGVRFSFVYQVVNEYPPEAEEEGSTAISMDDEAFVGWATGWEAVDYGEEVYEEWRTPEKALGRAVGKPKHVVSLGRGGEITMAFDPPIRDGEGDDFAVFENGVASGFLELAFIEVSSDGETFVRFDTAYLGEEPIGEFGTHDTTLINGFAGKYAKGWGTPFDLGVLKNKPAVVNGEVDLDAISHVKIVDVVGDGSVTDSFGNPVYDPYPAAESAGFDLDAVGMLHN
jgi:hypothetical protein